MHLQDFTYDLPRELIADQPAKERTGSRLLFLDGSSGQCQHRKFTDIIDYLSPSDLLVFNNTKVIPARLYGCKSTGGQLEILVERILNDYEAIAQVRCSKSPKPGSEIVLEDGRKIRVVKREKAFFRLDFGEPVLELLQAIGHVPLPPYISRQDKPRDHTRYQTVYSSEVGAVAAPTAGLHFDESLLAELRAKGVQMAFVTLHVGSGTFQPVRVDKITEHSMHSEWMSLSQEVCDQVNNTRAANGRVIAVGTTSVRCLETAAMNSMSEKLQPYEGETDIFIYPSYKYKMVDALITNFHLSGSTLLMLVCAFAGYQHTMVAYQQAIAQRYRFFSYGDAMLITANPNAFKEIIPPKST